MSLLGDFLLGAGVYGAPVVARSMEERDRMAEAERIAREREERQRANALADRQAELERIAAERERLKTDAEATAARNAADYTATKLGMTPEQVQMLRSGDNPFVTEDAAGNMMVDEAKFKEAMATYHKALLNFRSGGKLNDLVAIEETERKAATARKNEAELERLRSLPPEEFNQEVRKRGLLSAALDGKLPYTVAGGMLVDQYAGVATTTPVADAQIKADLARSVASYAQAIKNQNEASVAKLDPQTKALHAALWNNVELLRKQVDNVQSAMKTAPPTQRAAYEAELAQLLPKLDAALARYNQATGVSAMQTNGGGQNASSGQIVIRSVRDKK